jgi:hypothetical protein
MVGIDKEHHITWLAPSPLWGEQSAWIRLPGQHQLAQPVILRFANDMFIDEMMAMLAHSPWRFDEWVARPETWRIPMPTPRPVEITRPVLSLPDDYNKVRRLVRNHSQELYDSHSKDYIKAPATIPQTIAEEPLKLYHTNHLRYYVVTASLIRAEKGYPDYPMNLGQDERAGFVVRALVQNENGTVDEYGFVSTGSGMAWRRVGKHGPEGVAVRRVLPNEERLSLFPLSYPDRCGRLRQLFGGLIPVGRRDRWIDAPAFEGGDDDVEIASPVGASDGGMDHYKEILYNDVIAPWKNLIEQAEADKRKNDVTNNSFPNFSWDKDAALLDKIRNIRRVRDEIQTSSWYILHDLAQFLKDHLPNVWARLLEKESATSTGTGETSLSDNETELVSIFAQTELSPRLFVDLAIENLAVGGFICEAGVSLWERLMDLWKLEIYLKLSSVLHESDLQTDTLRTKVAADQSLSPLFKADCLHFIESVERSPTRSFFDFARQFEEKYTGLKIAALSGKSLSGFTDENRLAKLLQGIELPLIQLHVTDALRDDLVGTGGIKKSMWSILSLYWTFESYVDQNVGADLSRIAARYLHSVHGLQIGNLNDQIMGWFYGEQDGGQWYSFLQFADDLEKRCPSLHGAAMMEAFDKMRNVDPETEELIGLLRETEITPAISGVLFYPNREERKMRIVPSLAQALVEAIDAGQGLDDVDTPFDRSIRLDNVVPQIDERWPNFLFPLTDPEPALGLEQSHIVCASPLVAAGTVGDAEGLRSLLDTFAEFIDDTLPAGKKALFGNGRSSVLDLKPLLKEKSPKFVVRFVFERPLCGKLFPPVVSQATRQFEMAAFMDPDAPARPVHIRMPLDISPAGLRKYKKNAMFLFSDMMCGKMKNIKKMTLADLVLSVLPWPFHKDLPDVGSAGPCRSDGETLGLICSLSIPIITLCAMILLFIMVNLFNMIFKWLPWFFVCFPLPGLSGLKAKKGD